MTSRKWAELISKEFNCSMSTAKQMYHLMCCAYEVKKDAKFYLENNKEHTAA